MGSGVSGQVGFPEYLENAHSLMVYNGGAFSPGRSIDPDLLDLVSTYVQAANSPYTGEVAYDPDSKITNMETGVAALKTKIDALSRTTDWNTNMSAALSKALNEYGISRMKSQVQDVLTTAGEHLSPNVGTIFTTAKGQISTLLEDGADAILPIVQDILDQVTQDNDAIDALVDTYEEASLPTHFRSINRSAGQFFMAGAVHSSTFSVVMGQHERDFVRQVNEYRLSINRDFRDKYLSVYAQLLSAYIQSGANLTQAQIEDHLVNYRQWLTAYVSDEANKGQFVNTAAAEMGRLLSSEVQASTAYSAVNMDATKTAVTMKKEEFDSNIELDVLDSTWPFEVMVRGSQVLAALNGAPTIPQKPSKVQSAAGGALSGAALGAQVTGGNPIGIAVGGLLGLGASLLD